MLTSSMPVRLRLERHTSMSVLKLHGLFTCVFGRILTVHFMLELHWGDRVTEGKRIGINARMCGCMKDKLEGEDR